MLRFLTHKLKTQSLNEEPHFDKAQDDHDSGTESDDESGEPNGFAVDNNNGMDQDESEIEWETDMELRDRRNNSLFLNGVIKRSDSLDNNSGSGMDLMMNGGGGGGGRDSASSQFESCYIDSALPSDSDLAYDHHSSEEELEVINSSFQENEHLLASEDNILGEDETRGPGTENKRKWSQVAANRLSVESTSSSDDEVQGLLRPLSTPVEFCTSPPVDVHKPHDRRSQSPPPKLFLFSGGAATSPPASSSPCSGGGGSSLSAPDTTTSPSAGHLVGHGALLSELNILANPSPLLGSLIGSSSNGGGGIISGNSLIGATHSIPNGGGSLISISSGVFRGLRRYDRSYQPYSVSPVSEISSHSSIIESHRHRHQNLGSVGGGGGADPRSNFPDTSSSSSTSPSNNLTSSAPINPHHPILTNTSTSSTSSNSNNISPGLLVSARSPRSTTARESSRKRHRHHNPRHIQRPWLDFEKMQQLKARSVTTWRSGGELSLYCS